MFVFSVCSMVSVRRKTGGMHGTSEVDTECGGIRIFYVMSANFMSSTLRHIKVGKPLCCVCVCVRESERERKSLNRRFGSLPHVLGCNRVSTWEKDKTIILGALK